MAARRRGRVAAFVMLARALRGSMRPGQPGIGAQLAAVPRMIRFGLMGRYPGLVTSRVLLAVVGVLYILSPIDVVPEALLGPLGLGDDAFVAAWVAGILLGETDAFLRWEREQQHVVVGDVIR